MGCAVLWLVGCGVLEVVADFAGKIFLEVGPGLGGKWFAAPFCACFVEEACVDDVCIA